jgi:membrane-associated phospholipid phosphatase
VVIFATLAAGAIGALVGAALAHRWPKVPAPSVAPTTISETVHEHPPLRRLIRSRLDASTLTGLALTVALALVVGGTIAITSLLEMVNTNTGFAQWDASFAQWGADHSTVFSTHFLRDVSTFGGTAFVVGAAVAIAVYELIKERRLAPIGFLILCVGGQFAISNIIKVAVQRERPDVLRLTGFAGSSFPSGHSTASAACFAAFALLLTRNRSRRVKTVGAAIAIGGAVMIATSRVFLGVHWLTDVLAGLALGWAWFAVSSIAFGGRLLRFAKPVETAEVAESVDPTPAPEPLVGHST